MSKRTERMGQTRINNFGSVMIITEYRKATDIDVYFPEYDFTVEHATYDAFEKGSIKCVFEPRIYGMGYLGVGEYKVSENGKATKVYDTWNHMLKRCYDPKYHMERPTYSNCEVCEEWLNFQVFSKWYEENYYEIEDKVMSLDKDILVKGNKIYSPDTCVFVPQQINTLFVKSDAIRGELPIGVTINTNGRTNKFQAQCKVNGKKTYIGNYSSPEKAFEAYKEFKENIIKSTADEYKEYIPAKLYDAMYNYEVNIND